MKNVNLIWAMSLLLITLIHVTACVPPAITKIFNSDDKPPQISNVTISVIDDNSAVVRWITDEAATGVIIISDDNICLPVYTDETLTINHEAKIYLSDFTYNYNYEILIISADGINPESNESRYKVMKILRSRIENNSGQSSKDEKGGNFAPDFTLNNINGQTVSLSDFYGKKILVHFWSYTCPPCTEELPLFQGFYSGLPRDKLELITISVDDDTTGAKDYLTRQGYKFPVLFDSDGAIDKKYKNSGVPASYLISGDGYILDKHAGPFDSLDDMRKFTGTQY